MNSQSVRRVIEHYDGLLASKHAETTRVAVERSIERPNLVYIDRPLCTVLRPAFIARSEYRNLTEAGAVVAKSLRIAARRVVADPVLRAALRYPAGGEMAFYLDPAVEHARVWSRLDGFVGADGRPSFVELNAFLPGGLSWVHSLGHIFDALPIMEDLRRKFSISTLGLGSLAFDAMVRSHRLCGGSGLPAVALLADVDFAAAAPDNHFVAEDLRARGIPWTVAPVESAEWRHGRLHVADQPTDVIALVPESVPAFMTRFAPPHPLLDALARGSVRILNGAAFTSAMSSKALFSVIGDPEHAAMFDRETTAVLGACIPTTRVVREGFTTWGGEKVDLLPFAASHREQLVLKPSADFAGRGVHLGWECSQSDWEAHLQAAATGRAHVVQQRVTIPSADVPRWRDGALAFDRMRWSADPFVWNDEAADGLFVRMTAGKTLNVGAGASGSAVMIVEDE